MKKNVMMAVAAVGICAAACGLALRYDGVIKIFFIGIIAGTIGCVIGVLVQYYHGKKLAEKREAELRKQALEHIEELKALFFNNRGSEYAMWRENMEQYALYGKLDPAIQEEWKRELENQQDER